MSSHLITLPGVFFLCGSMPSYAQSFFMPIIFKGMGWSRTAALLLSAPPYFPTTVISFVVSYFADKYKHRSSFIAVTTLTCLTGLCILAFGKHNPTRYFGAFLINAGNGASVPCIIAFAANNNLSHSRRALQSSIMVSMGGIGGIFAALVFKAKDSPRYIPGLIITICAQAVSMTVLAITVWHFARQNRLLREGKRGPIMETPGFYYTL